MISLDIYQEDDFLGTVNVSPEDKTAEFVEPNEDESEEDEGDPEDFEEDTFDDEEDSEG